MASFLSVAQAAPIDGTYRGTTSQGRQITVTVTNGTITQWMISFSCGSTTGKTTVNTSCPVLGDSFSCGSTFCAPGATSSRITGTFNGNSVSGTFDLRTQPVFGGCCSLFDRTWSALNLDDLPTLHDQTAACASAGSTSQFFTDLDAGSDLADDLMVPDTDQWSIRRVVANGVFGQASDPPIEGANVRVLADDNGLPGATLCSYDGLTPLTGLSVPDLAIDLSPECVINPGKYWLQVQPQLALGAENRQWFWQHSIDYLGDPFVFRDVDDLFATGCTTWSPASACFDPPPEDTDLCFQLQGTRGESPFIIFIDGFESGDLGSWAAGDL